MRNGQGVDIVAATVAVVYTMDGGDRQRRGFKRATRVGGEQQLETIELTRTYSVTLSPDGEGAGANQRHWR